MRLVNISIDIYNILIGTVLFISLVPNHYMKEKLRNCFNLMIIINIIMSAADAMTMHYEGPSNPINFTVFPAAMFIYYCMSCLVITVAAIELVIFVDQKQFRKPFYIILWCILIFYFAALAITPYTDLLYTIDANNNYSRGKCFYLIIIVQILLYADIATYLIINRKVLTRKHSMIIGSFIFFPQIAQIIQLLHYGISIINAGYSMAFIMLFIHTSRDLEENLENAEVNLDEKENELNDKLSEIENSKLQFIKMQNHTIESLSNLVENRDEDTGEHVRRTRAYVELLAIQLMKNGHYPNILTPRYVRFLKRAAPMHDIGKIVVPDAILKKPGRLTHSEFALMKRHASEGGRIVHEILDGYEDPEYIQITADIATHHHEKWNGTGYPGKLVGEAIPLSARIMAIADVFDALVSPRVYKSPMSYDEAFQIIEEGIGVHFDPIIAREFINIKEKAAAINESYKGK